MWWIGLGWAEEPADPHRWLEHERRAEVRAWWAEQDEEARAWASAGGRTQEVRAWLEAWSDAHPPAPMLADHRAGTSLWVHWRHAEDRAWESRVSVGAELLDDFSEQSLCVWPSLSPDGRRVAWGRSPAGEDEEARLCILYTQEIGAGPPREVLRGRGISTTWPYDEQSLIVSYADGHRVVRARVPYEGEPEELDRGRRAMVLLAAPDGQLVAWSAFDARGRPRALRFAVGDAEELPWMGKAWPWFDQNPVVAGVREGELLVRLQPGRGEASVVRLELDRPDPSHWRTVVTHRPGMDFTSAALHRNERHGEELLVVWSRDGLQRLEVQPWSGGPPEPVELPGGPWTQIRLSRVLDERMVVLADSPVARSAWERDAAGQMTELPGGWRREGVVFEALEVPVEGGTVPITLLRPQDPQPASAPVWLDAYAGFGISMVPHWSRSSALWLAAGGTYAFVHARGGRERGGDWHMGSYGADLGGRYDEMAQVAQWFVDSGRAQPGRLVLSGQSNGGLTMAATLARRPELFGAAVGVAGVYDLVYGPRYGLWWPEEYGARREAEVWPVRRAESPVHRVPAGELPPVLLITGERDPVVSPAHTFKLGAAWSELAGGPVLVRVDRGGTHGGEPPDRGEVTPTERDSEAASTLAFVLRALEMDLPALP